MRRPKRHSATATGYSIGALSRAVGVPVQTLRTWESRYGYPTANRLPSGHRRYPPETVERLRLVGRLLEQGHSTSAIVPADADTLRRLLRVGVTPAPAHPGRRSSLPSVSDWFAAVDRFDVAALDADLLHGWSSMGALLFLEERLSPFLTELGRRWASGRLDVSHEHFATTAVGLFLAREWRAMSDVSDGSLAVCATFEGERHELGLHMAAVGLAVAGWRIRFLGADTPLASIESAANALAADAVVIGASEASQPDEVCAGLLHLRENLPPDTTLFAGGIDTPAGEVHAKWPGTIAALVDAGSWLSS